MLSPSHYLPIVSSLCQTLIELASELLYHLAEKSTCVGVIAIILMLARFKQQSALFSGYGVFFSVFTCRSSSSRWTEIRLREAVVAWAFGRTILVAA